jgi:hypothetical protein
MLIRVPTQKVVKLDRLIADVFEDDDLARVAIKVRAGKADKEIAHLQDAWLAWAESWKPPPEVPDGYLRPFAFNNWAGYDNGGLASAWIDQVARPGGAGPVDQQLLRHLLFCYSVALPDPLFRSPDGDVVRPRWTDYDGLAAAIETVHRLRKLIHTDIVVTVPRQAGILPEAAITIGDAAADLFDRPPADSYVMKPQQVVALDLASQIGPADGEFDPYLPTDAHIAVFRLLAAAGDAELKNMLPQSSPELQSALLPEILHCDLPDPVGISFDDVVSMRKDGYFDDWRRAVADGVHTFRAYAEDHPGDWPNSANAMRTVIADAVTEKASAAKKDLEWTKKPVVRYGLSALLGAGAVGSALVAAPVAAVLGAAAFTPSLLNTWARYKFKKGTYARHVAVFTTKR